MTRWMWIWLACAACGVVNPTPSAEPDAGVVTQAPGVGELAVAAGRLTGKGLVVDVQLGAIDSPRAAGGTVALETASPIVP